MERYIGLDAHVKSCTFGVISETGKHLRSVVVETNGRALVEFIRTVPGRKHLCLEEGTQSGWLYEILSPHVDEIVVAHLIERNRGRKDDETDAFARAEDLRVGKVTPVFKDGGALGALRSLVDVQAQVTADRARVQNRLKALFRSRGVAVSGSSPYALSMRDGYIEQLATRYRGAALLLYAQLDALRDVKKDADKQLIEQARKHKMFSVLSTCPGLGPIRVAQLLATVMTPHRFRTARQLWSYSGLAIVMRSSADWEMTPSGFQRVKTNKTRGLNRNYNRRLKALFKGAATTVVGHRQQPMYGDYVRLTNQGTKPPMAKLTLSRRIAATALTMWKNEEAYDPHKYQRPS